MTRDTDERGKLALADARDKAYERLHALAGSRATPPRWDDIATLLRERDELYQQLRSPAGHAEREALREAAERLEARASGYASRSHHIFNGALVSEELLSHASHLRALSNAPAPSEGVREIPAELPQLPDDDSDFTPDLARKIIAKYQDLLRAPVMRGEE